MKERNSFDEDKKSFQFEKVKIAHEEKFNIVQLNKQGISSINIHQFQVDTKQVLDDLQYEFNKAKLIKKKKFIANGGEEGNKLSDLQSQRDIRDEMSKKEDSQIMIFKMNQQKKFH